MFLGFDFGTSSVKAILIDAYGAVITSATSPLNLSRPKPLWSEQNPKDWVDALCRCLSELSLQNASCLKQVEAIGLTGQMHGAVCLDGKGQVLRPAILWNDGRAYQQCEGLNQRLPGHSQITGNLMMPGFTLPKLMWLSEHEPHVFAQIKQVLLPKDYVRYVLTGDFASDLSDASGTGWVDVSQRAYSHDLLEASGMSLHQMPQLFEGTAQTGWLKSEWVHQWGLKSKVAVYAGGGDNAAGALSMGIINSGQAMLSLGTSGVYFVANDQFRPNADQALHAFCHAIPNTWHQMGVILSAASSLSWWKNTSGAQSVDQLIDEVINEKPQSIPIFLPYLFGERTPYNDPLAQGCFWGLNAQSTRAAMTQAVLEGVAFAFLDSQQALEGAGTTLRSIAVIGGGSKSELWGHILASVLGKSLNYHQQSEVGPALGAAQLARVGFMGLSVDSGFTTPPIAKTIQPRPDKLEELMARKEQYTALYHQLKMLYMH